MSLALRLFNAGLRIFEKRKLASLADVEDARRRFARQGKWFFRNPRFACYLEDELAGIPALWASVRPSGRGAILYFHGGAYALGGPETHRALLARISQLTGLRACIVDYRLAPEHPFPAAPDDAWGAWRALLARGYDPQRIVLGGDSAGGGLALSLLGRICRTGGPKPAGLFAFSPWTDLTLSGDSLAANAERDVLLPVGRFAELRDAFLRGVDPRHPAASPLFAEFPGAPPVLMQASRAETLLADSIRMKDALASQGARVELQLWDDTPHVWQIFQGWLPEADSALARVGAFVRQLSRHG